MHFLGVPFNSDGTPPEVEHPPQTLRAAGLLDRLASCQRVHDRGDLPIPIAEGFRDPDTGVLNWQSWQAVTGSAADAVQGILEAGGWPLVVGGDCSILVGLMAATTRVHGKCGLIFVDGHGDFHKPASSPTGEPADMELAALTGRAPCPMELDTGRLLADEDIVVLGVRELDGIEATPIRVLECSQLTRGDLLGAVSDETAALCDRPVWLHLDVDVIDAELMPVIYPAGVGLSFDQTTAVLASVLGTGNVIGMDVACFHPNLDRDGTATQGLVDLLVTVLKK